jgi:vancomycin resistance protein YoaR
LERNPADFGMLFTFLLLLALAAGVLGWQYWHAGRIYTGVSVAGVPVGGMTRAAALAHLNSRLIRVPLPPASLVYAERQWPLTADQARVTANVAAAVDAAYLVGRQDEPIVRFREQLRAALFGVEMAPAYVVDNGQLRHLVSQIASEVRRPARPGRHVGDVEAPPEAGVDVDIEATAQALAAGLAAAVPGEPVVVPLSIIEVAPPPSIDTASATPSVIDVAVTESFASPLGSAPLLLRDERFGMEFALDPAALTEMILSTQPLRVDTERLRAQLGRWAAQIDIPPQDARLRFNPASGEITVLMSSRAGRRLDIEATAAAVETAILQGSGTAPLVVVDAPPAVDMNRIGEMGIRELVVSATTYFAGSSAERMHNIEIAASKLDGVVVPPQGVFSFNQLVQDVTAANGFEDSLVIWGDRTAVGVGGGVCQVSTTVFRAAYLGGFPIVERYNHGYIVDWYGEPGLDATIFTPTVDLRFRNDTNAYLLIEPVVDRGAGAITFNFYGTKPNRQVTLGAPEISDVAEPPAPVYTVDASLAAGQRKQVDWAKRGMTVKIRRTIVENGETRTDTLTSKYQPWRAVYLVAPGAEVPATPTPAPDSATPEPAEETEETATTG